MKQELKYKVVLDITDMEYFAYEPESDLEPPTPEILKKMIAEYLDPYQHGLDIEIEVVEVSNIIKKKENLNANNESES